MATPVGFEGSNLLLRGNGREVRDMDCFYADNPGEPARFITCHRLSQEELINVVTTGCVWLSVWQTAPDTGPAPVFVSGEAMVNVGDLPSRPEPIIPLKLLGDRNGHTHRPAKDKDAG